jgi:hypothetical protein
MAPSETFKGEIKVASRIVDYLSSGLYETPAACLKELVNNSYDADAHHVEVFVKPDADRIIIEDDGVGMSKDEFVRHFERISESHKRDESSVTPSGRPVIGKIGIGFIAANEICNVMEIFSTKAGAKELLHVSINFDKMRLDPAKRKRGNDLAKADYEGEVLETERQSHYTRVFLKNVRGEARAILAGAKRKRTKGHGRSLYGLNPDSVADKLKDSRLKSWSDFDPYSETMLRVALNVPVGYHRTWIPNRLKADVREFEERARKLRFNLSYDGSDTFKPIVFRSDIPNSLVSRFRFAGENVSASGYFFVQHGALRPQDLNGLLIRIRHAAVGGYDSSFMGFPSSEGTVFQKWVSAEIWADDRLEDALNIDRKTLRIAHPAYVELQEAVHEHLSKVVKDARSKLYDKGSKVRKKAKAKTLVTSIKTFATDELAPVSKTAAREVVASWRRADRDDELEKRLLKRFSVLDLYRVVLDVARDLMTGRQLAEFVRRLTKRITG